MVKHQNKNECEKCLDIILKFPNFYPVLRSWFVVMRGKYPELHCSEAGRGMERQTQMFREKKSRAVYGASAHNWNAALDTFIMLPGKDLYDREWYETKFAPEVPDWATWYGAPGSKFYERPHIEVRDWKMLAATGVLKLVEFPSVPTPRMP